MKRKIVWVESDRFDVKPNKSPWIEMGKVLQSQGFDVKVITGYKKQPYVHPDLSFISLYVWDIPFLFRFALLFRILTWIGQHAGRGDIIILKPESLLIAPLLRMLGYKKLHLDVRTLPLRANNTIKQKIDHWIFWTYTIKKLRKYVNGYSFITERLKAAMEDEFKIRFDDYVIWQSSVNVGLFRPVRSVDTADTEQKFILFYHGSIYLSRGVDRIIEAVSLLRPEYKEKIKLIVVGPQSGKIALADKVRQCGVQDHVFIAGHVPYEQIPNEISKADCCICPLPDLPEWNVSSPLKVFEYMACGKPIILTPIPAHKDVAGGQNFVVWTKGYEAEDIRDAIEYACDNKVLLSVAAKIAPEYVVGRYDWATQGVRLATYLRNIFS